MNLSSFPRKLCFFYEIPIGFCFTVSMSEFLTTFAQVLGCKFPSSWLLPDYCQEIGQQVAALQFYSNSAWIGVELGYGTGLGNYHSNPLSVPLP